MCAFRTSRRSSTSTHRCCTSLAAAATARSCHSRNATALGFLALRGRRCRKQRGPQRARCLFVLGSRHLSPRRADPRRCRRSQSGLERESRTPAAAVGNHRPARHRHPPRNLPAGPGGLRRNPASHQGKLADTTTDAQGEATLALNLLRFAKATYRMHLVAQGFEADGGRGWNGSTSAVRPAICRMQNVRRPRTHGTSRAYRRYA